MAQRAISELIVLHFPNVPAAPWKQLSNSIIYSSTVPLAPLFSIPSVFWWVERRKMMWWDSRRVENRARCYFHLQKHSRDAGLNFILNLFLELLDCCSLFLEFVPAAPATALALLFSRQCFFLQLKQTPSF